MSEDDSVGGPADGVEEGLDRRTLVRLLVGFGVGVPILVEGTTFVGLVSDAFLGGSEREAEDAGNAQTAAAASPPTLSVGEDFLPDSGPAEVLIDAELDGREFAVTANVASDLDAPYEFGLGPVRLEDGRDVGERQSVAVAPGETRALKAAWRLPEGTTPASVRALGVVGGESPRRYGRRVALPVGE